MACTRTSHGTATWRLAPTWPRSSVAGPSHSCMVTAVCQLTLSVHSSLRLTPPQSPYDPECGLFYSLAARHGLPLRNPLEGLGSVEGCRELLRRAGYTRVQVGRRAGPRCRASDARSLGVLPGDPYRPPPARNDPCPYR